MTDSPTDAYLHPYREAVERFGAGFHATLWSSREAQQRRFDVVLSMADLGRCTVLDAGCGHGDFAQHLIERGVEYRRYIGIDGVKELIDAARARGMPRCEFAVADLVHDRAPLAQASPDFTCISGTLNTMDEPTAKSLVRAAFDASAQGVIFNFLSNRPGEQCEGRDLGPARRFDTLSWLDWALHITSRISFTQDYLEGHDATIMMRHE